MGKKEPKMREFPVILTVADGYREAAVYLERIASDLQLFAIIGKVVKDKPIAGEKLPDDFHDVLRGIVDADAQAAAMRETAKELHKLAAEQRALDAKELSRFREGQPA